jgi:23S rRNA (pseudouridine1915-N3)-methyltransferase
VVAAGTFGQICLKLTLAAIGKLKSGPEKLLAEDYQTRINQIARQAGIKGITVYDDAESQKATSALRMAEEAHAMRRRIGQGAQIAVFDERGSSLSSEGFAALLSKSAAQSVPEFAFLIGGPDGHDPELRAKANHIINLGAMTWPHRLARIMVLEQIYRALTIILHHPYHRA